jgi:UDP-N-acetyl-D-mannosaminuronic acid dehydrogenase
MPYKTATKIRKTVAKISSPKIIALGVTYKPNVHDLRESPALKVIDLLREDGYDVKAYDPLAEGYSFGSIKELAKDADGLVVLVEHKLIKDELDREEEEIKQAMRHPIIVRF